MQGSRTNICNNIIQENFSEVTLSLNFNIEKRNQVSEKGDPEESIQRLILVKLLNLKKKKSFGKSKKNV